MRYLEIAFRRSIVRLTLAAALAAIFFMTLPGCSSYQQPESIPLVYTQESFVTPVQGAQGVTVSLAILDVRTDKSKIGEVASSSGGPDGPITAQNDPPTLIRQAIEHELSERGFNVGKSRTVINVEIVKLWAEYVSQPPFPPHADADASLYVRVWDPTGKIVYEQTLDGHGQHGQVLEPDHAGPALSRAIDAAIDNLFSDSKFIHALVPSAH